MADVRISALAAAVAANLQGTSLVPTTDSQGSPTTVKVTLAQMRTTLLTRATAGYAATDFLSLGGAAPPASGWIRIDGTTVTSSTPVLSAIQTWNQGATVFTGILLNVTNTASSASSLLIDLQLATISQFKVDRSGTLTVTGGINGQALTATTVTGTSHFAAGAGSLIGWTGRTQFQSPSDGVLEVTNNAGTGFTRLQFGGTTNGFPSLKRSSATLIVRLADDSADASIQAETIILTSVSQPLAMNTGSQGASFAHLAGQLQLTASGTTTFFNISAMTLRTDTPSTTRAPFNIPHGSAPTSPVNGDIWTTTSGLFARINGVTVGPYT